MDILYDLISELQINIKVTDTALFIRAETETNRIDYIHLRYNSAESAPPKKTKKLKN
jgi:hypothetical protein